MLVMTNKDINYGCSGIHQNESTKGSYELRSFEIKTFIIKDTSKQTLNKKKATKKKEIKKKDKIVVKT